MQFPSSPTQTMKTDGKSTNFLVSRGVFLALCAFASWLTYIGLTALILHGIDAPAIRVVGAVTATPLVFTAVAFILWFSAPLALLDELPAIAAPVMTKVFLLMFAAAVLSLAIIAFISGIHFAHRPLLSPSALAHAWVVLFCIAACGFLTVINEPFFG